MGMNAGQINSIENNKNYVERKATNFDDGQKFEDLLIKANNNLEAAKSNPNYVNKAKELLEFTGPQLREMANNNYQALEDLCGDFDPAVIVALRDWVEQDMNKFKQKI
jgi:hypothetical protein